MTKIVLNPPSPTYGNRYLAMPWGQFGVTLSTLPIRPLGRHIAGREGIVPGLIFRRWGRIATLASRSDPWRRRRPPQVRETGLGVLLHPTYRLSLRRRLVDAYRADPPADEPPSAFFVDRGEYAALVRALSVEAVGGAGPCDGHGPILRPIVGNRDVFECCAANGIRHGHAVRARGRAWRRWISCPPEIGERSGGRVNGERTARHLSPEVSVGGDTARRSGRAGREYGVDAEAAVPRSIRRVNRKCRGFGSTTELGKGNWGACGNGCVLRRIGHPCTAAHKGGERRSRRGRKLGVNLRHRDWRASREGHFPSNLRTRSARAITASSAMPALSMDSLPSSLVCTYSGATACTS